MRHLNVIFALPFLLAACGAGNGFLQRPNFNPADDDMEQAARLAYQSQNNLPMTTTSAASLWGSGRTSLFGERRALQRGDLLTVVIEIDDRAEMSNSSEHGRSASQSTNVEALWGLRSAIPLTPAASLSSSNNFQGNGSIQRNERIALRVAATVINILPNGIFEIAGNQEVRLNSELRELTVTGFVTPSDINRKNEIGYDRIAGARISYGGRGQVSAMQQPTAGYQILEKISPF